jgi:predicted secreted hydrolase
MNRRNKSGRHPKKHNFISNHWLGVVVAGLVVMLGVWFYHEVFDSKSVRVWSETRAAANDLITLPKDDAPHQSKMEWWYYNGHLITETGKRYSFHDAVFLVNSGVTHMVNHVSLADYQTGRRYIDQRGTEGNLSAGAYDYFNFTTGDWSMSGSNGIDKLRTSTPEFGFNLGLTSTQPPVFHGRDGIISLAAAGSSYYYSRPRMAISGTLKINGETRSVKGLAWFDHQWGDFSTGQLGWDWFSLQLDNNSDIMIYQLRDKTNKPILYTGSITENGKTGLLGESDFSLRPGKKWTSNKTGISYPVEWQINIPGKNIALTTRGILNDSEFDAKLTTYNIYWEGAVEVTGTHTGQGFMELSGYRSSKH